MAWVVFFRAVNVGGHQTFKPGAFGVEPAGRDIQKFVTVMQRTPESGNEAPRLPFDQPAGAKWEIRVARVVGQFALSFRCPRIRGTFYPNAVVEKLFGLPATTRNWNTIAAIHELLEVK